MATVIVRGTGDVGSAVAHKLYRAGYAVLLHDTAKASHTRRAMAFVDALYEGFAELDGVLAKRAKTSSDALKMLRCHRAIPVVESSLENVLAEVCPDVLVDARMRKHHQPESQRGLAPLTIGLGPNFEAGANVDVAVETKWGDELGAVLFVGRPQDLAGEPQPIDGHARDRYVYSPVAGTFTTALKIGDLVTEGQEVASVGDTALTAPLSGCLRGLSHDGASVSEGSKVVEIDPRGIPAGVKGMGKRPRIIAEGVLKAMNMPERQRTHGFSKPFSVGTLIGTLGGLIGLGGAEFRLPALVGLFKFDVKHAIAINVLVSLVTVASALIFRAGTQEAAFFQSYFDAVLALVLGSLAGAFIGGGLVSRLNTHKLHRLVGWLLIGLAAVMGAHGLLPHTGTPLMDAGMLLFLLGVICGVGIGLVGSMLGVAGGELLIPTLVLLYGADIKTAGTLALSVSLPMLLVTIWRLTKLPTTRAAFRSSRFIFVMAAGSLLGAFIGSQLVGMAPDRVLSAVLAIILLISAIKTFGK